MSLGIKLLPRPECPQLKTIQATASTSFSCVGKRCVLIETRTYTGPWKTNHRRALRTQVSSPSGSCFSWLCSRYLSHQELNGLTTLYVEVTPLLRMLLVRLSLSSWLGAYGRKSLASALLYIDVGVRPSSEALFFFELEGDMNS